MGFKIPESSSFKIYTAQVSYKPSEESGRGDTDERVNLRECVLEAHTRISKSATQLHEFQRSIMGRMKMKEKDNLDVQSGGVSKNHSQYV